MDQNFTFYFHELHFNSGNQRIWFETNFESHFQTHVEKNSNLSDWKVKNDANLSNLLRNEPRPR